MRTGFSFKHKHSSEFGIVMRTVSRPIQPERKSYIFESPIMDGTYDFSDANSYGRAFYKNRVFALSMLVFADDIYQLQQKLSEISIWLTGEGVLIFDDTENVQWKAKVVNGIDYAPESKGREAILSVIFNVEPFSYGLFGIGEDVRLDSDIPLFASIPLDWEDRTTALLFPDEFLTPLPMEVFNIGTWYTKPKIALSLYGTGGVSITCGEKTLTLIGNNSVLERFDVVIDFENEAAWDYKGNDLSGNLSGEFFELAPGNNTLIIDNHWFDTDEKGSFAVQVTYNPRYMYDFDEETWKKVYNDKIVSP